MNEHITDCDLCNDSFDTRLDGATTECGHAVCEACCEESVEFVHSGDEVFAYLVD